MEQWRLSAQKLLISRDSGLVVMFMPLRSALLHNLPEECRLLIVSGVHGRNGLSQIGRVRGPAILHSTMIGLVTFF